MGPRSKQPRRRCQPLGRRARDGKFSGIASRRNWLFSAAAAVSAATALPRRAEALAPPDPRLEALLAKLSLEAKVGQLLMIGVGGTDLNAENAAMLRDLQPGALILLGRNVRDPAQVAAFCAALQAGANLPRFISMDQEGGTVVRLTKGATVFPGAMATGATQSTGLAYLEGKVSGAELKALGVNMNLAPVLDVNSNRKNPAMRASQTGPERSAIPRRTRPPTAERQPTSRPPMDASSPPSRSPPSSRWSSTSKPTSTTTRNAR